MKRIALIGLGRWGQNIARTLATFSDCQVTHICDASPEAQNIIKEIFPNATPTLHTNSQEINAATDIDAVIVATPGSTHTSIALPFITKGLPTFIEKPFTTNLLDAQQLTKAAQSSGALIFVGHIHLYNPAYHALKELLPQLGTIRVIHCEGGNNGPYRDEMSALWDWAPHDIAILLDLIPGDIEVKDAWGFEFLRPGKNLHDTVHANLRLNQSVPATVTVSWLLPEKRKKIFIVGTESSAIFDDTKSTEKITLLKHMGPTIEGNTVTKQEPTVSYPTYDSASPLTLELRTFIDTITTQKPFPTNASHALKVVQIVSDIERKL